MNKLKISAIIPSFRRDGALVPQAIRALQRTYPQVDICVLEDARKPFYAKHRKAIEATGAEIVQHTDDTKGNLNGLAACRLILRTMRDFGNRKRADWVLVNDSDTTLFGNPFPMLTDENIRAVFPSHKHVGAHLPQFPNGHGWGLGAAYALRMDTVRDLFALFELRKGGLCLGEDREISTAARMLYGVDAVPFVDGLPVGMNYVRKSDGGERPLEDAGLYIQHAIAHWGNRYALPAHLKDDKAKADYITARMKYANDLFESQKS